MAIGGGREWVGTAVWVSNRNHHQTFANDDGRTADTYARDLAVSLFGGCADAARPPHRDALVNRPEECTIAIAALRSERGGKRRGRAAGGRILFDTEYGCEHARVQRTAGSGVARKKINFRRPGVGEVPRPRRTIERRAVDGILALQLHKTEVQAHAREPDRRNITFLKRKGLCCGHGAWVRARPFELRRKHQTRKQR